MTKKRQGAEPRWTSIARYLNNIGVGNSTSVDALHAHLSTKPGYDHGYVDRWLDQQSGGAPIGGIPIKNPKIRINGKTILVLREFKPKKYSL